MASGSHRTEVVMATAGTEPRLPAGHSTLSTMASKRGILGTSMDDWIGDWMADSIGRRPRRPIGAPHPMAVSMPRAGEGL